MIPALEPRAPARARRPASTGPGRRAWWRGSATLWPVIGVALLGLLAAHQLPAAYHLDLTRPEAAERLNNFYQVERNASGAYRWSRPVAQVHLLPLDSRLKVCLELENPTPAARALQLALIRNGRAGPPLQVSRLEGGTGRYCSETGAGAAFLPGDFTLYKEGFLHNIWFGPALELKVDPLQAPGERRELGVVVRSLEVETGPAFGRPGLPTLLETLLTLALAAGTWGLLRSLTGQKWFLLGGAGLPLAVWLGLVAFGRVGLAGWIEFALFAVLATLLALAAVRLAAPALLTNLRCARRSLKAGRLPSPTQPATSSTPTSGHRWLGPALVAVAGAVLAWNLAGLVLPGPAGPLDNTNWGLRRFAALPRPLALVIAAGVPVATLLAARLNRARINRPRLNPYRGLLILAGLATLLFYLLRTRNSYGDGNELVGKLELFVRYLAETGRSDFMIWREREPLDFALHFLLWRAMLGFEWWQPAYTYVFTSVLAGGLFVAVAGLTIARLTASTAGRWLMAGLLFSSATLLVFFGYIESYTFVTLAALVYLWLALLALDPTVSLVWPALALIIAVLLHPQAIFLGPSLFVVLLWRAGFFGPAAFRPGGLVKEAGLALLVALTVLAAGGLLMIMYNYSWSQWGIASQQFGGNDNGAFKPLFASGVRPGSREDYPVLSGQYLAFQFNLEMLVAPLALPLILVAAASAVLAGWRPAAGWIVVATGLVIFFLGLVWNGAQAVVGLVALGILVQAGGLWLLRGRLKDAGGLLLGTCAVYTWLFALAWNPDLGSNDWDLLSLHGVFGSLLAGYVVTRRLAGYRGPGPVAALLAGPALALGTAWIVYNAFFSS